jgi:hypothetical protein
VPGQPGREPTQCVAVNRHGYAGRSANLPEMDRDPSQSDGAHPWRTPALAELARGLEAGTRPHAIVLVEGLSDQSALEALAERRGRQLEGEGVVIAPMGGATTIVHYLDLLGPGGFDVTLAGLCDVGEEGDFQRGLERAGIGAGLDRSRMEGHGFFVCVVDLEDELIRAMGAEGVVGVIEAQGELGTFHLMRRQPAQRERTIEQQLRRFMGTRSGRKIHYARLLVEALDLDRMPHPLEGVLSAV